MKLKKLLKETYHDCRGDNVSLIANCKEICNLLNEFNVYIDELPLKDENGKKLDYLKNIYVTYSIKNASDFTYKDIFDLELQIITDKKNKFDAQEVAMTIDSKLNKKVLTAARITRKNAWLVQFIDDENKQNIVLQYDLNKF